jgi:hypothetical protein
MSDGLGPGQEEVWRRFAAEIGAQYIPGDFWQREQILATVPPWTVSFEVLQDTLASTEFAACTRLTARYVATDGLGFSVRRRDAGGETGLPSATPRLTVGDPDFDRRFDVIGHDAVKVLRLLSNDAIRAYLMAEPHVSLGASRVTGDGRLMEIACVVPSVVETRRRLLGLFELMGETLQHLRAIGSAADTDPGNVV